MKKSILFTSVLMASHPAFSSEIHLNGEVGFLSDKLLRGFSLSNEENSWIGRISANNEHFYSALVGFGNIQINNGANEELVDAVIGKHFEGNGVTWDLGYVHHFFTDVSSSSSGEWFAGLLYKNMSVHLYHNSKLEEQYVDLNASHPLGNSFSLKFHAGALNSDKIDSKDFLDYSLGLEHQFKKIKMHLTYAYNDNDGVLEAVAGDHFVLGLSTTF